MTTGKGEVWVTYAFTINQARELFRAKFYGKELASIVEAAHF